MSVLEKNVGSNTVNSRFKKVHFSFLKSRVVWFKKDLCSEYLVLMHLLVEIFLKSRVYCTDSFQCNPAAQNFYTAACRNSSIQLALTTGHASQYTQGKHIEVSIIFLMQLSGPVKRVYSVNWILINVNCPRVSLMEGWALRPGRCWNHNDGSTGKPCLTWLDFCPRLLASPLNWFVRRCSQYVYWDNKLLGPVVCFAKLV